jgi:hypothetical protein
MEHLPPKKPIQSAVKDDVSIYDNATHDNATFDKAAFDWKRGDARDDLAAGAARDCRSGAVHRQGAAGSDR